MKTLIKQVQLVYPNHPVNGNNIDILVEDGTIVAVGEALVNVEFDTEIKSDNLILLPGLIDMQCAVGEPGFEDKEDLSTIDKAAQAGGFKTIVVLPTTEPVIDNKSQVNFIQSHSMELRTKIQCYGSITRGAQGKDLSELFDLHSNGVVGFSDGKNAVSDVNLMKRALEYAKSFNGMICSYPHDERINPGGMINESASNAQLGIKQTPGLAEEIMLNRDLFLLDYTKGRLHVSTISTMGSVELIRAAKGNSQNLTAGVALHNLLFNETALSGFDSNFKTQPPLRGESDRKALIEAVIDGTIDILVTDHTPENIENKDREFDHASYGMTMLETALSLINTHLKDLPWDCVAQSMSLAPRKLCNQALPVLMAGADFDFTLFDKDEVWVYDAKTCQSKSTNSPYFGSELQGRVIPL
ncbi:MAG TPA: dihydroorotase [Flavobacteriales bacterium]|jgi:dihydroorotase|nr:dihydroorotase [Flavobacteriales bacterium]MDB9701499.1 dihydroorotase [Salibacteraceae bacterium]HAW20146.1 dihydroorotase [Flavobacteriales bacterium]